MGTTTRHGITAAHKYRRTTLVISRSIKLCYADTLSVKGIGGAMYNRCLIRYGKDAGWQGIKVVLGERAVHLCDRSSCIQLVRKCECYVNINITFQNRKLSLYVLNLDLISYWILLILDIIRQDSTVRVLICAIIHYCNIDALKILASDADRSPLSQTFHNFTFHCQCNKLYRTTLHINLYTTHFPDKDLDPLDLRCSQKE